jgi:hypothetical protein
MHYVVSMNLSVERATCGINHLHGCSSAQVNFHPSRVLLEGGTHS